MKRLHLTSILFLAIIFAPKSLSASLSWEKFSQEFKESYQSMALPPLKLSYVENLKSIRSVQDIETQETTFRKFSIQLRQFDYEKLSYLQQLDYDLIHYEVKLNLERITLEREWHNEKVKEISEQGLSHVPLGQRWYAYFLKRWVDIDASPSNLHQLGLREIDKVKRQIQNIRLRSGLDEQAFDKHIRSPLFFYKNQDDVQKAYETAKLRIDKKLPEHFPFLDLVPEPKIAKGTNPKLAQTPGYYADNTLFYNYFDKDYNKRQIYFLYLHEALPGHHYQSNIAQGMPRSDVLKLFYSPSYLEGWAAYIEDLAIEINLYDNMYSELGKWEWDLIRSVRVVLDIALNDYGWSDQKALEFWQKHIKNQDDIALREIARMKRWPAQVITYKYGANKILQWKSSLEKEKTFSLKSFHKKVLKHGAVPLSVLEKRIVTMP